MIASAVLYAALIAIIFYWLIGKVSSWTKYYKKVQDIQKIPGPNSALPLIGDAKYLDVSYNLFYFRVLGVSAVTKPIDGVGRLWLGQLPFIILTKPESIEKILTSSTHIDKSVLYRFLHPWLGTGLLTSTGKKWHARRKLLTPAFHFQILEDFLQVMVEQSNILVSILKDKANGEIFDMFPYVTNSALDVMCDSAMGCHVGAQYNRESEYVKAVNRMGYLIQERQRAPWLHPDFLYRFTSNYAKERHDLDILQGFTRKVIEEKRANLKNKAEQTEEHGKKKRRAFLDLLLSATTVDGKPLSNADIQEEVDTFMFEGHDTTAAGMNWCLFLLGLHPDIQEKCYQELREIFEDSDRDATLDDLRKMKYTEYCIKEAQRVYPSVPFIGRELNVDADINGFKVPAGSSILINITALHLDPEVWSDPFIFDPDRFEPERMKNMHPYSYIPFSAGPRNCIGQKFAMMEEKVTVSSIIRNFRIESCERRDIIQMNGALILRPEVGLNMKFWKRNS